LTQQAAKTSACSAQIISKIIDRIQNKSARTQHIILLGQILEPIESLDVLQPPFPIDSMIDTESASAYLVEELIEYSLLPTQPVEDNKYSFDKSVKFRLHTLVVLLFAGQFKNGFEKRFNRLLTHVLTNSDSHKMLDSFGDILLHKQYNQPHNAPSFFEGLAEPDKGFCIPDNLMKPKFLEIYLCEIKKCVSGFGKRLTLDVTRTRTTSALTLPAKEKVQFALWNFTIIRKIPDNASAQLLYKLLVELVFGTSEGWIRMTPIDNQKRAWAQLDEISHKYMAKANTLEEYSKAAALANLAGVWVKALTFTKGPIYIDSDKPSTETSNILVVTNY